MIFYRSSGFKSFVKKDRFSSNVGEFWSNPCCCDSTICSVPFEYSNIKYPPALRWGKTVVVGPWNASNNTVVSPVKYAIDLGWGDWKLPNPYRSFVTRNQPVTVVWRFAPRSESYEVGPLIYEDYTIHYFDPDSFTPITSTATFNYARVPAGARYDIEIGWQVNQSSSIFLRYFCYTELPPRENILHRIDPNTLEDVETIYIPDFGSQSIRSVGSRYIFLSNTGRIVFDKDTHKYRQRQGVSVAESIIPGTDTFFSRTTNPDGSRGYNSIRDIDGKVIAQYPDRGGDVWVFGDTVYNIFLDPKSYSYMILKNGSVYRTDDTPGRTIVAAYVGEHLVRTITIVSEGPPVLLQSDQGVTPDIFTDVDGNQIDYARRNMAGASGVLRTGQYSDIEGNLYPVWWNPPVGFQGPTPCHRVGKWYIDDIGEGLIPEFVGRLPVSAPLEELDVQALIRILVEPRNALVKQYEEMKDKIN